jgi:hypothetical protein
LSSQLAKRRHRLRGADMRTGGDGELFFYCSLSPLRVKRRHRQKNSRVY